MSLEYAILGFLQHKPCSGYDLKAEFDLRMQRIWTADQSQIYRTLTRLTKRKWIKTEVIKQKSRPDRKVYHITEAGRSELIRWLTSLVQDKETRQATMIQIYFAGHLSDDQALALFEGQANCIRQKLSEMNNNQKAFIADPQNQHPSRHAFFRTRLLEGGIQVHEAMLAWEEEMIAQLKRGEHAKANALAKAFLFEGPRNIFKKFDRQSADSEDATSAGNEVKPKPRK